jgi:hypothetical protein
MEMAFVRAFWQPEQILDNKMTAFMSSSKKFWPTSTILKCTMLAFSFKRIIAFQTGWGDT